MTAAEAKAIADQVAAKQLVRGFSEAIERAAKEGRYERRIRRIEPREERALTSVGFLVTTDAAGNTIVSWADAGAH